MTHPFLRNPGRLSLYIVLWGVAAIALGAAMAAALPAVTLASASGLGSGLDLAPGAGAGLGLVQGLGVALTQGASPGPDVALGLNFAQALGAGAILAFIFGLLALPLWDAMRYGSLTGGNPLTRLLSHVTLALITLALWLSVSAGIGAVIGPPSWPGLFLPVLPFLLVTGTLLYIVVTMIYASILTASAREEADEEEEADAATAAAAWTAGAENGSADAGEAGSRERTGEGRSGPEAASRRSLSVTRPRAELEPRLTGRSPQPAEVGVAAADKPLENIAVKTGRKIDMIPVDDILYLKSEGDYVMIHTATGRFLKEQTMKQFEEALPAERFVRVHRSYMVNVRAISRIERYGKGERLLVLHGGATVRASEGGYRALRSRLNL